MAHAIRLTVALDLPAGEAVAAFHGQPDTWLPTPLRRNGLANWQIYLWAAEVGVLVDCAIGDVDSLGLRYSRTLTWRPLRGDVDSLLSRAVPSFHGELCVVDRGDGQAELVLTGAYRPPGGAAGSLVDRVALHRLARRTGRTFLHAVAARLREEVHTAAS
jgi:hypothetical protein